MLPSDFWRKPDVTTDCFYIHYDDGSGTKVIAADAVSDVTAVWFLESQSSRWFLAFVWLGGALSFLWAAVCFFFSQTCLHCAHDGISAYFAASLKGRVIDRQRHLLTSMLLRFTLADFFHDGPQFSWWLLLQNADLDINQIEEKR